ncbi:hypothetical protein [Enterobacter sp. Bisph1]|nr:hypothetical protein [Enterobacter sp. Bisph1]
MRKQAGAPLGAHFSWRALRIGGAKEYPLSRYKHVHLAANREVSAG